MLQGNRSAESRFLSEACKNMVKKGLSRAIWGTWGSRCREACRAKSRRTSGRIRRYTERPRVSLMLPAILPFLFAVFWASSYAAAKIGLADISPYLFVAVRLSIAAIAALILVP